MPSFIKTTNGTESCLDGMDSAVLFKSLDRLVRKCNAAARLSPKLDDKVNCHRLVKKLDLARLELRREMFALQDCEALADECASSHPEVRHDTGVSKSCGRCGAVLA